MTTLGWSKSVSKLMEKGMPRAIGRVVLKGFVEYCELVGEVVFEMAFDSILRFDKSERPLGGGELFMTAMTLSVVTSGLMKAMGKRGADSVKTGVSHTVKASMSRLILPSIALSLQVSMLIMRIPVITGNIR
jgi:hypothetical protein